MYHLFLSLLLINLFSVLYGKTKTTSRDTILPQQHNGQLNQHEDLLGIEKQSISIENSDTNSNQPFEVIVGEKQETATKDNEQLKKIDKKSNQEIKDKTNPRINTTKQQEEFKKKTNKNPLKKSSTEQLPPAIEQVNILHWKKYPQWASSTQENRQFQAFEATVNPDPNSINHHPQNQESTLRLFRPQQWAIGGHVGINDILAPVELKAESSFGPMMGLWLRYHWNSFSGIETGIQQLDFSNTPYGLTEYYGSLLFQTGWWENYHPYLIVGPSLFKQEQSSTSSEKWRTGINLSTGLHFGSTLNLERFYWIPALHFKTIFSSGSEKQVSTLGISLGIAFYFDDNDIDTSVFSLR